MSASSRTRKQLAADVERLNQRFNILLKVVSLQRQMLQRLCLEEGFAVTGGAGSSTRTDQLGQARNIWAAPADSFPVPDLGALSANIHASGVSYVG